MAPPDPTPDLPRLPLPMVGAANGAVGVPDLDGSDASREFYGGLHLGFLVSFAFRALLDQHHTLLARHGITEFRAAHGYILLAVQDHGVTLTDLVAQTRITKQAISPLIGELEDRGFLKRAPDPQDRRRLLIELTDLGRSVLKSAVECWREIEDGMADLVGSEAITALREAFVSYLSVYSPVEEGHRPKPRPVW